MQLKTEILRVIYEQPTSDEGRSWFVLKTDKGKASGEMLWTPAQGERVLLDGEWSAYKGERQFRFKAAMLDIPSSPRDRLRYVCANADGIGPALELSIWEQWGETWWDDAEPDVVPRLAGKKFRGLRDAMNEFALKRDESEAVAWLAGKGASMGMAKLAWDKWTRGMQGLVSDNCYRLAELPHYGFRDVDREIRLAFGIEDGDPRRIRAGIVYAMRQQTEWGATLIAWSMLLGAVSELLAGAGSPQMIANETKALFEDGALQPFAEAGGVALMSDYEAEREILEFVGK